eukprot:GFKZ01008366.1.p2 GENE.GFKZ01008366.1~~GFKZ01008366.1.p2  ORF type:complete len:100 (+),score=2.42 GFKZ01008366.1:402-701(+)
MRCMASWRGFHPRPVVAKVEIVVAYVVLETVALRATRGRDIVVSADAEVVPQHDGPYCVGRAADFGRMNCEEGCNIGVQIDWAVDTSLDLRGEVRGGPR